MSVRSLDRMFAPQTVAIVGASERAGSVGRAVFENMLDGDFAGSIVPINPRRDTVQGVRAVRSIDELGTPPDLVVVCTPPATVPGLVRESGRAGAAGLLVISAGFGEAGAEGRRIAEEVKATLEEFPALRLIGPNCLGMIVPRIGLNASFAADLPPAGHLAFVSQSGALCTAVLDWAVSRSIGFSHFVSIGNMIDVEFGDLVDFLAGDGETHALLLYVESIPDARKFLSAARAFNQRKPIIAYKAGRFAESAKAAGSHTGALAGDDAVYDAAFRRAGIERVSSISDLFDCAGLLSRRLPPAGPRLAIVTNAGGPGVVATDALLARGGTLATLADDTIAALDLELPPSWSRSNPVDVLGDAPPDRMARALQLVLVDPGVDAVLVVIAPQAMTEPTDVARAVRRIARRSARPVMAAWMGGRRMDEGIRRLDEAGIPAYRNVEDAVDAFMHLVSHARNLELLHETPREMRVDLGGSPRDVRERLLDDAAEGDTFLSESASKELLDAYGIATVPTRSAGTVEEAIRSAEEVGYPVVLKVLSADVTHKTDVGGVALRLADATAVERAWTEMMESVRRVRPDARIDGVTVQRMVQEPDAIELILGAKRDPTFGTAIVVGSGGTLAELHADRAIELPPLNERLAEGMLRSLRIWPLLEGYRGRPGADLDELVESMIRFSYLVAEHPRILEIDVNPLLATPATTIALDARIRVDEPGAAAGRPFAHLAIRPYPGEFTAGITLVDGTEAQLRPIRPEDEPAWHDLLGRCSPESIWFRLRSLIKHTTHAMATRYCFIDYDREIAIVVMVEEEGKSTMIGVGRLVADADHETAEYAVLIRDDWQGRGVGTALSRYCHEIAGRWGVRRLVAYTTPQNTRMVHVLKKLGYRFADVRDTEWAVASLELEAVATS